MMYSLKNTVATSWSDEEKEEEGDLGVIEIKLQYSAWWRTIQTWNFNYSQMFLI